jgi:hypothetical protein
MGSPVSLQTSRAKRKPPWLSDGVIEHCGRQGGCTTFAAIASDDAVNGGGYWHVWNGARERIVQVDDGHHGVSAGFCPQRGTSTVELSGGGRP